MGGTVLIAVLSVGAVAYSFGRLFKAHLRERSRELRLARQRALLDERYGDVVLDELWPARPLSEYDKGFLDGAIVRHEHSDREAARAQGAAAHAQ